MSPASKNGRWGSSGGSWRGRCDRSRGIFVDIEDADDIMEGIRGDFVDPPENEVSIMRISDQYLLRQVADEYLVIPVGEAALKVKGLIALSESGSLLYRLLRSGSTEEELVDALRREYDVDQQTALNDTREFLDQMRTVGILIDD